MARFINSFFILLAFALVISGCAQEQKPMSFAEYWPEFRKALLSGNWQRVSELSVFPLELKGVDDSQPAKLLSESEFVKLLPSILSQSIYVFKNNELVEKPLKSLIEESHDFDPERLLSEDQVRVQNFLFQKKEGRWKLVRIYFEN